MATVRLPISDEADLEIEDKGDTVNVFNDDTWDDITFDRQQAAFVRDALTRWLETGTVAETLRVPNPACHECGGDGICGKPCGECWKGASE